MQLFMATKCCLLNIYQFSTKILHCLKSSLDWIDTDSSSQQVSIWMGLPLLVESSDHNINIKFFWQNSYISKTLLYSFNSIDMCRVGIIVSCSFQKQSCCCDKQINKSHYILWSSTAASIAITMYVSASECAQIQTKSNSEWVNAHDVLVAVMQMWAMS